MATMTMPKAPHSFHRKANTRPKGTQSVNAGAGGAENFGYETVVTMPDGRVHKGVRDYAEHF